MAQRCEHCGKGIQYGHAVSHAKNRVRRIFKPNLQKVKAYRNGVNTGVKLCTSCIKRLHKYKELGVWKSEKPAAYVPVQETKEAPKKPKTTKKEASKKPAETINIDDIVGKSN